MQQSDCVLVWLCLFVFSSCMFESIRYGAFLRAQTLGEQTSVILRPLDDTSERIFKTRNQSDGENGGEST